jgi:hypothetical protein
MAIYFDGRKLVQPQAATKIDDIGMYGRGAIGANTLALIGEAGGGEPGVVQWFTDPAYAKAILRSGDLLTSIQRAYSPSGQVNGAYLIAAIRVNPALGSFLSLKDSTGNPVVTLNSVDWGVWNNQIRARIENATTTGKKVTISYGNSYDQGDNIYKKSLYIGLADGMATAGTIGISNGSLTKTMTLKATTITAQQIYYNSTDWKAAPTTKIPFTTYASDSLYIGSDAPFDTITFDLSTVNSSGTATVTPTYWNGAWTTLVVTDNTIDTGHPLGKDGTITFTAPPTWLKSLDATGLPYTSVALYWVRIRMSAALNVDTACDGATDITLARTLSIDLTDYETIQELADYIDAQPGWEAAPITTSPNTDLSTQLDNITANTNIMAGGNTTISGTAYTGGTHIHVAGTSSFGVGDYITVATVDGAWKESRKITAIGTSILNIDSALSSISAYVTGSVVREVKVINSDLQAVIDWINAGNTGYVTAIYPETVWEPDTAYLFGQVVIPSTDNDFMYECSVAGTSDSDEPTWGSPTLGAAITDNSVTWITRTASRGAPGNQADTYMIGGTEGTTTQTHWDDALTSLQSEDTPLVSCISHEPSVWAALSSHVDYMSSTGKKERRGFCGGFSDDDGYSDGLGKWNTTTQINASVNQMLTYAFSLNFDRMCYVGPGFTAYDENGVLITYNGAISAALVAGMAAGVDVAEALTHKTVSVLGLEYNLKGADLDRLLEGGVCPLEYAPGIGYRVCQSITTWLADNRYNRRELSVGRVADYVARSVRERLDRDFIGRKGTTTTLISIKNATISILAQAYRDGYLAGDTNNPPYKNIQVRLDGDACYVDFECSPVIPINYIPITIHLTIFTSTLTA